MGMKSDTKSTLEKDAISSFELIKKMFRFGIATLISCF
jgi:hypothetical protein